MSMKLYSNKTGREIRTGQTVTTVHGLKATLFAWRADRGTVFLQTQSDSNSWQVSISAAAIGATFKPVMTITITRESAEIFTAVSDVPYWNDGQRISERLAFDGCGNLSNSMAQAIDRQHGKSYLLVSPFGIKNPDVISQSRKLAVGQSFTWCR